MTRMLVVAVVLAAIPAGAVTFPDDAAYLPLHCGGQVMTDAYRDDPGFFDDLDLVGSDAAPTGLRAADATYLYLRIRLDQDPAPNGQVMPSSWGMAFDTDGDRTTYELLVLADGTGGPSGTVSLATNTVVTIPNSPTDPADTPPAKTYPFSANGRSIAAGTTIGGTPDYFLDIAVPWADLVPLGLDHTTRVYVWVASSNAANQLDGDFACYGGAGPPALDSGAASDQTTGDPTMDPNAGNSALHLEGGGGCSASGGGAGWLVALALIGLSAWGRARRRACRAGAGRCAGRARR